MVNQLGDVELDARGVRALAHPVRLAILLRLRANGVSTATRLAPLVGASPSVTSWHVRHLAEHGLVEDAPGDHGGGRSRWWQAVGSGFRFEIDANDPAPALALMDALEQVEGDLVQQWSQVTRPRLEPQWLAVASRWNTGVIATPDEVAQLEVSIEKLLEPLANRSTTDAPEGARRVRILRYAMPEAPHDE